MLASQCGSRSTFELVHDLSFDRPAFAPQSGQPNWRAGRVRWFGSVLQQRPLHSDPDGSLIGAEAHRFVVPIVTGPSVALERKPGKTRSRDHAEKSAVEL